MTPKFARAVDPVFVRALDLLDRIDSGHELKPEEEKARLVASFEKAGAELGQSDDWMQFAKYALTAWIDSELGNVRPWEGREWWNTHSLELDYWGQGLANVEFYRRAQAAAQLASKDALEVFYICVVLGFRGFYENAPEEDKLRIIEGLALPADLRTWVSQQARSIRLGRELPRIADARRSADVAPPRYGRQTLIGSSLLLAIVAGIALGVAYVRWFAQS